MAASPRVLIVGAGPAGLTTALELARRGILPVVAEKRQGVSGISPALGLTPRALQHLAPSGAAEPLIAAGISPAHMLVYRGVRLAAGYPLHAPNGFHHGLVFLHQAEMERILCDQFESLGGHVLFGVSVVGVEGASPYGVRFSDGRAAEFDLIVGADGTDSFVRTAAGIAFEGYDLPGHWSLAEVTADGWQDPQDFAVSLMAKGISVIAPLGHGAYRLVTSTPDAVADLGMPMDITSVSATRKFRISVRQAARYRSGGIFLAGDAAHSFSPIGGRGMNVAIADGALLADAIAGDRWDAYEAARRAVGRRTIVETEIARRMMTGENWAARLAMRAVTGLSVLPGISRRLGRFGVEF